MSKAIVVDSPCPMCHATGHLSLLNTPVDVPYFGEALETMLRCASCGFRHADFMILAQKDPMRLSLEGKGERDLQVRVIRSNSGTIRIPELGFLAEPTPLSESFVSNVEGVIDRARKVLVTARTFFGDDPEKVARCDEYLAMADRIVAGEAAFTLTIDDPFGNSAIVSESVARRALTEDEVAALKTGMVVIDKSDLEGALHSG